MALLNYLIIFRMMMIFFAFWLARVVQKPCDMLIFRQEFLNVYIDGFYNDININKKMLHYLYLPYITNYGENIGFLVYRILFIPQFFFSTSANTLFKDLIPLEFRNIFYTTQLLS